MKEEKQYTIRNLEELNEIDEREFSELEAISFNLPNGELVNPVAGSKIVHIKRCVEDIYSRLTVYEEIGMMLQPSFPKFFIGLICLPAISPFLMLEYIEEKVLRRITKKEAYEEFCKLRDKINDAYKMPVTYRSFPSLDEKILE